MEIKIERCYNIIHQTKESSRYLVDRRWPRGVKKELLQLDIWIKELCPSNELCKWYNHDPTKWNAFKENYFAELDNASAAFDKFFTIIKGKKQISLIYSSKEESTNNAAAFKEYLLKHLK